MAKKGKETEKKKRRRRIRRKTKERTMGNTDEAKRKLRKRMK
jgi:hypothetical protein